MSRIRSSGTKPEKVLRRLLRAVFGPLVRYNVRSLPGTPDVVVRSVKLAVFMDGCYWHGCPLHFRPPSTRSRFWIEKIRRNEARDHRTRSELRRSGWKVWVVWEHDLKPASLPRTSRNLRRRALRLLTPSPD